MIVLDSNVLATTLRGGESNDRRVVRACLQGRLTPAVGDSLLREYEAVIEPRPLPESHELLTALLSVSVWVPLYFGWKANLREESSNHLIELAVAARATAIITNNNTRGLGQGFPNIPVLTPGEFLDRTS